METWKHGNMETWKQKIEKQQEFVDFELLQLYIKKGYMKKVNKNKASYHTKMGEKVMRSSMQFFDGRIVELFALVIPKKKRSISFNPIK